MRLLYLCCITFLLACQTKQNSENVTDQSASPQYTTTGFVEREMEFLDQVLDPQAEVEILSEGYDWTEGPLWIADGNYLLFSDIPPNTVFKWDAQTGAQVYLNPSGYTGTIARGGEVGSNALVLDPQGNLVLCQHGDRRLARMTAPLDQPKSEFETIVDRYEGKRLNSPNDAIYTNDGHLIFTDPPYGLEHNVDDPAKELDFQGVYLLETDGELKLLTDQLSRPNGLALSVDETKLYVANSDPERAIWMEYHFQPNGTIDEGRVFFDATHWVGDRKGLPDGMKVHPSGHIFATGPGGVLIFDPEGQHLGTIRTGQATSNCALDLNNRYLYITADMYLMRIAIL